MNYEEKKQADMIYEKKSQAEMIRVKDEIKIKYYFWEWCMPYGWRQMGNIEGYDSIEELKEDKKLNIYGTETYEPTENWKILKAEVIESKKI